MKSRPVVSIILPAYNEKENLISLIPEISEILSNYNFEIIVVDDASLDGTRSALENFNIVYQFNHLRQGLGKSIGLGIELSRGDYILVMDSDGDHNPCLLLPLIGDLKTNDLVLISRFSKSSKSNSPFRYYLSQGFNLFVRIMTKGKRSDYLFGYWGINRRILAKLNFWKIFWGYGDYCIRLFYYLERLDLKIKEINNIPGKRRFGSGNPRLFNVFIKYSLAVVRLVFNERKLNVSENKTL